MNTKKQLEAAEHRRLARQVLVDHLDRETKKELNNG